MMRVYYKIEIIFHKFMMADFLQKSLKVGFI